MSAHRLPLLLVDVIPLQRALCWLAWATALLCCRAGAQPQWPVVTHETKPWTRWWWHGSAVNAADVTRQLEEYAAAGLGGVEITPIYGVRGAESQFLPYLDTRWTEALVHTLREAERLGLGVDLATGNGWPFGGPWVEADGACRNLVLRTYKVAGGERLAELVRYEQPALVRAIGRRIAIAELKQPISANDDLQELALEQVKFPRPLPLAALTAVSANGETVQLAARVAGDGALDWTAPPGAWTLYAAFAGWHGKQVERAGPGGEGDVIDHFSRAALGAYLARFDKAFAGRDIASLRGFFNDSYEVDDAAGEADWTPKFFAEFQERRGYDLRDELPALAGVGDGDRVSRVLCDYRETISDLLLEEFTQPWSAWAEKHQAVTRNQAHGSPGQLLDLYAASGIPETEGDDRIKFITASSAAHVAGKRLASAEACTWLNEHFLGTLAESKRRVDDYFLGGINHVCYHGTPYAPADDRWPGRLFYASVHYGTTNSFWPHFHALNEYVTRCQSFLQQGESDADVLVYDPVHDQWSQPGRTRLVHFDGSMQGSAARPCGEQLLKAGYQFDFISDRQLAAAQADRGIISCSGHAYQAVVVPQCRLIPVATLAKLSDLARQGATLIFQGPNLPQGPPGWGDLAKRRATFDEALARLLPSGRLEDVRVGEPRTVGKGRVVIGAAPAALAATGVKREQLVDQGVTFTRRRTPEGYAYFLRNESGQRLVGDVPLRRKGLAIMFDPLTGRSGTLRPQPDPVVRLSLEPDQTCIVVRLARPPEQSLADWPSWEYEEPAGKPRSLRGPWTLEFLAGGPELPATTVLESPGSWTNLADPRASAFSGTAKYSTTFDVPLQGAPLLLDLGEVRESAAVTLNGKRIATLFAPPYRVVLEPAALLPAGNSLEIEVANLMANRIAALERSGDTSWKKFYNINFPSKGPTVRGAANPNQGPDRLFTARHWEPRPSGLLGPVAVTPLARR